nr:immunoglobulin heavy chain junction region [Macaca mulatta]
CARQTFSGSLPDW